MFERFTDRARRVVVLAQEEARMLSHNYIGTEHLLLGLVREGEGVAAQVLTQLGASSPRVRQQVLQLLHEQEPGVGGEAGEKRQVFARRLLSSRVEVSEILVRLDSIVRRLDAIERHLGIAPAPPANPEMSAGQESGGPEPAGEQETTPEPEP